MICLDNHLLDKLDIAGLLAQLSWTGSTVCNVSYLHARTSGCTWLVCHRSSSKAVDLPPHYALVCWLVLVTAPHMSMCLDNTTPISNDGIAWLGPMVQSLVRVLGGVDFRPCSLFRRARPDSEEVIKQAHPTPLGVLATLNKPGRTVYNRL